MTPFSEMVQFFDGFEFSTEPIHLNQAELITDPEKIVKSHIEILKHQSGKEIFLPYYHRLKQIYETLREDSSNGN